MIDLEAYIISQKLSWTRRLFTYNEAPWVTLFSIATNPERLYTMGPLWSKSFAGRI